MSGDSSQYFFGYSAVSVPLSANATVTAPKNCVGGFMKIVSGGTCAILGQSGITTDGYIFGATEVVSIEGPAKFLLAAAGSTVVIGIAWRLNAGYSTLV